MKFHPSRNALVILLKILSCLSVKTHLHCFRKRHQEIQLVLSGPVRGQNWSFTGCALNFLANLFVKKPSHHQFLERLPLEHIWTTCGNTGTVVLICNQFICPQKVSVPCKGIVGVQWRSSFVFLSTGISSNSSKASSWLTTMFGPDENPWSNEFFVLVRARHSILLNQLGNAFL